MQDEYKEPYLRLWSGITAALKELEESNYGNAKKVLIEAQQAAEEIWLSDGTEE